MVVVVVVGIGVVVDGVVVVVGLVAAAGGGVEVDGAVVVVGGGIALYADGIRRSCGPLRNSSRRRSAVMVTSCETNHF